MLFEQSVEINTFMNKWSQPSRHGPDCPPVVVIVGELDSPDCPPVVDLFLSTGNAGCISGRLMAKALRLVSFRQMH